MNEIIVKDYVSDCLLVSYDLANNEMSKKALEAAKRLKGIVDHRPSASLACKYINMLCDAVGKRISQVALNCGLNFRDSKPLALISGAGIAGLAASFELRARGFKVVIAEKRTSFSRFNVINLNIETQVFLKKFNLLEKFEKFVASRIIEHRYVLVEKNKSVKALGCSDVSGLELDKSISMEPKNFEKLFDQDGIYSVPIGLLQEFLAENALEAGVNIFGDTATRVLSRTQLGGVAKVQITADRIVKPDLFFIAEGAHSKAARELGMGSKKVMNVCTGENWIFGNMTYAGNETFVVSLIDASEKTLRIANVIFNAKSKVINIAVTAEKDTSEDKIREQIQETAHQVFTQKAFPMEEIQSSLLATSPQPVHVVNRTSSLFSTDNVFCIGDSAGSSSPLAGLGGTLGLTLVPVAVSQLLDDYQAGSKNMHQNFNGFSEGYTTRWIQKSEAIKRFCISIFEKEQMD